MSLHKEKPRSARKAPSECPSVVRIATRADAPALLDLLMTGVAREVAFAPVNEEKVRAIIDDVTRPVVTASVPRAAVAVIDGPDKKPIAAAPLLPRRWWYSREYHYVQPWIYVHEQHRKSSHARTLIETMMWWSERASIPLFMVVPATPEMAIRREIYSRYAKPFGGSFIHQGGLERPTPKPQNTRVATVADYPAVKALCMKLSLENGSAPLDEEALEQVLAVTLSQQRGIIMLVCAPDGDIVGCACLALDQWDYSLAWHYSEMWVFVDPDHRHEGTYALDLLNFCKFWAEQTGIPCTLGITSVHRTAAKMRLYRRHLKPLEHFFLHDSRLIGGSESAAGNFL